MADQEQPPGHIVREPCNVCGKRVAVSHLLQHRKGSKKCRATAEQAKAVATEVGSAQGTSAAAFVVSVDQPRAGRAGPQAAALCTAPYLWWQQCLYPGQRGIQTLQGHLRKTFLLN